MRPLRAETSECQEWAEAWQAHRARGALESNLSRAGIPEEEFWARYASWVAAFQGDYPGVLLSRVTTYLQPGGTVLDIGAGAGAFAIPLAAIAAHVTAIEPSPAQAKQLRNAIEREHVENVEVVERLWEDVDAMTLGSYDLVLAVHSLQMTDIAQAIRNMCRVASDCLLLVHTAGHSLSGLSHELFDIEPGPDYTYLPHVLNGLGHNPRVEFAHYGYDVPLDLQLEILRYNPGLDAAQCNALREYVISHGMTTIREGALWLRRSYRDALISVTSSNTDGKESVQ